MKSDVENLKQNETQKAEGFLKILLLCMITSLCGGLIYLSASAMDMYVFTMAGLALLLGGAAFFLTYSFKLLLTSSPTS